MSESDSMAEPIVGEVSREESVTFAVLRLVSVVRNQAPLDLEEPLNEAIDPEALNSLFRDRSTGSVSFRYLGCTVTVHASGDVRVDPSPTRR